MEIVPFLFADDIIIIANSRNKIQRLLDIWLGEIVNFGTEINTRNGKVIIINKTQMQSTLNNILCKDEEALEEIKTMITI